MNVIAFPVRVAAPSNPTEIREMNASPRPTDFDGREDEPDRIADAGSESLGVVIAAIKDAIEALNETAGSSLALRASSPRPNPVIQKVLRINSIAASKASLALSEAIKGLVGEKRRDIH